MGLRVAQVASFLLIYVSYVLFYLNRKNYAFWLNELVREGRRKEDVSVFGSVMELSYGVGKLAAGPLVDSTSPSTVLAGTLGLAATCNLLMFSTGWMSVDVALWGANGFVQSAAWPALAAIFMNWFKESPNRGIWYSVLSTNQNLGSALIPVVLTPLVGAYGWRAATAGPGVIGLGFACVLLLFLSDGPLAESAASTASPMGAASSNPSARAPPADDWRAKLRQMASSSSLLSLGVGYACLQMIRVGIQDWTLVFLQESRGVSMQVARDCLVALEIGGFVGGVSAGAVSDRIFGGKRGPPLVLFTLAVAPIVAAISWLPLQQGMERPVLTALYFVFGFASFGPHMLVGLTAREVFPQAQATAGSFTKSIAQVGGTMAGYPLSLVSAYGWTYVSVAWAASAVLGALAFYPLLAEPAFSPKAPLKRKHT